MFESWQALSDTPCFDDLGYAFGRIIRTRLRVKNQIGAVRMTSDLPELLEQFTQGGIGPLLVDYQNLMNKFCKFIFCVISNFSHVCSPPPVKINMISRGINPEVVHIVNSTTVSNGLDMVYFEDTSSSHRILISNGGSLPI